MDNSFFIFTNRTTPIKIERFHICTWEFNNDSSLVELGVEIAKESINANQLSISIFIPWLTKECEIKDLYDKLSIAENSRFIFNDSLDGTDFLDGGRNKSGVIHRFSDRNELCILPISYEKSIDKIITINVTHQAYLEYKATTKPNIYFRFSIKPQDHYISMRKNGISKSTIIYDIKINEKRNIPDDLLDYFRDKQFCKIDTCFSFNIVPNKYDIIFFDASSLKSIRTLEYDSFNKYLGDKRVKKDALIVVFNKKKQLESYSFFSIYAKERIGSGQVALAILINIVCGILLFIPSYRNTVDPQIQLSQVWSNLPIEIYIALAIALVTIIYFTWPSIINKLKKTKRLKWYAVRKKYF